MLKVFLTISLLLLSITRSIAQDGSLTRDSDAFSGETFYRGVASPARSGSTSYVQVYNPPGSGINTIIDAYSVWAGTGTAGEYGIIHYNTPFNSPNLHGAILDVGGPVPVVSTYYGQPNGQTQIFLGTYPTNFLPQIDNAWAGPSNIESQRIVKLPYPIIIGPGDGIVFWNPTPGLEGKVEIWLREKPTTFRG